MINRVIGLDCGASHTTLVVWNDDKRVLEKHDLPGINFDLLEVGPLRESLILEFDKLTEFKDFYWVVGMAGLDDENEVVEAEKWFREILEVSIPFSGLTIMSDIELLLWAGSKKGVGIGLIAGTGSNCFGRDSAGVSKKVGGMSHILSDEGGGFSVGWKGLHLVAKMADGRVEKTSLLEEVFQFFGIKTLVDLKNFLVSAPNLKVQVAKVAPLILAASGRGEDGAGKIVAEESTELVRMLATVSTYLDDETLPIFLAGSLFKEDNYRDQLIVNYHKYFPKQKLSIVNPIEGALSYAKNL